MAQYEERFYRHLTHAKLLVSFRVVVAETDLYVYASRQLIQETQNSIMTYRSYIESYVQQFPDFATSLSPWKNTGPAPEIIRQMIQAAQRAGVGPMASVAGIIAEYVGKDLLFFSNEIIVENGGDLFIQRNEPFIVGIYAGNSPFSHKIGIRVDSPDRPIAMCTSSGLIGHSLSFGKADAVVIRSTSAALADAVATATGNRVKEPKDISPAIDFAKSINGIEGVLILIGESMGAWGNMEIVPVKI